MISSERESTNPTQINTNGGAVVEGNVNTGGGDFVGRDKIVITEEAAYQVYGLTNPYLGLRAFRYEDSAIYAGREQLAQETVQRLTQPGAQQTLIFITGASGSGKSSFAQAGLIPLLENHYAAYEKTVRHAIMRPSSQPLVMLADALQKLHPNLTPEMVGTNTPVAQINLLLIDQFEELFIQSDASQRTPFCDFLTNLPSFAECRTHVLVTLRVDYLDELFAIQPLWAIAKEGVELRTMKADDLGNAIQKPLQVNYPQKRFALELLDRLVQDAGEDAALLPLLQVTLAELWKTGKLVLSNYHSLTDAIRQRAETVYAFSNHANADPKTPRSDADQQELLGILLDLINVSVDGDDRRDVRQRRTRDELEQGATQRPRLIEELVNARLLAAASETRNGEDVEVIDIIHESLIDNWDRLRQTIEEQRQRLQRRARFKLWLSEWLRNGRQDGYLLLTDMQLAEARALVEARDIEVQGADAREFYKRSIEYHEAEQQRELQRVKELAEARQREAEAQRQKAEAEHKRANAERQEAEAQRRRAQTSRWAAVVAIILMMLLAVAAGFALLQTTATQKQARRSRAGELAAKTQLVLNTKDPTGDLALLLAKEAVLSTWTDDHYVTDSADNALRLAVNNASWRMTLPRYGHTEMVNSAAFSPDGKLVVSGGGDTTVHVWNVVDGDTVHVLKHDATVTAVSFSSDGKIIISSSFDGSVRLWDVTSGQLLRNVEKQQDGILYATMSTNGKFIASQDIYYRIRIRNVEDGKLLYTLNEHDERSISTAISPPPSLAFSHDNRMLFFDAGKNLVVWDIEKGKQVHTIPVDQGIVAVRVSDDGKYILVIGGDDTVSVLDTDSYTLLRTFSVSDVKSVAFSPDGQKIVTGGRSNSLQVFETTGNNVLTLYSGNILDGWFNSVAFSPDGNLIATANYDGTVRLWNSKTGEQLRTLGGHTDDVTTAVYSLDGQFIAAADESGTINLWNARNGILEKSLFGHNRAIWSVAFSPNGKMLTSAGEDLTVQLWETNSGKLLHSFEKGHFFNINSVIFSVDGKFIFSAGGEGSIRQWDILNRKSVGTFPVPGKPGHLFAINSIATSPDGKFLVSGGVDGKVILWSVENHEQVREFIGHSGYVTAVAFSFNGNFLVSGSADGTVRLWDTESGEVIHIFTGHVKTVSSVAISPNDKFIVSASEDGTARLWDIQQGILIRKLEGHSPFDETPPRTVTFSPDGKSIVTGAGDRTLRLWDVEVAESVRVLRGHTDAVSSVTVSHDGKLIASTSSDSTIRLWNAVTGSEIANFEGNTWGVNVSTFDPSSSILATGDTDGKIQLWDVVDRKLITEFQHIENTFTTSANSLSFSPDSQFLASAGGFGVTLRNILSGEIVLSFMSENFNIYYDSADFSPDGHNIAVAVSEGTIVILDIYAHKEILRFSGPGSAKSLQYMPDGSSLVSVHDDGTIRIWDVKTGKQSKVFYLDINNAYALAISPDGKSIAVAGDDRIIHLWDIEQGIEVNRLLGHTDAIFDLDFTPDNQRIVSASSDGTIRIWMTSIDVLLNEAVKRIQREVHDFTKFERSEWGIN